MRVRIARTDRKAAMPELPFIQVLAQNLDRQIAGRVIHGARVKSPSILKTYDPPVEAVEGKRILNARRVGKLVILDLSGDLSVVYHLMRHGRLQLGSVQQRSSKDMAFALALDDGRELRVFEMGPKKRAAVYVLMTGGMDTREPLAGLGVDPLSDGFTAARLAEMLAAEKAQVKRFLTLQRHLTGIGNAYSDEVLWEARLSPLAQASRLTPEEIARLHAAIRETLGRALQEHRERFPHDLPMKEPLDLLRVHRHGGEPCPRCGTRLAEVFYAEKETYYCPGCQTHGKVYADRRLSRLLK